MGIDPQQYREWYGVLPGASEGGSRTPAAPAIPHIADGLDPKAQNAAITKWASMVQRRVRDNTSYFPYGKTATADKPGRTERRLTDSIRSQSKKSYGVIDRVSFQFERHGVFVHKGVGRGYKMQGGMVIRTAKSEDPLTRQVSPFEDDPRRRVARPWFNPILEQTLPELADKLAEINADAVVNATRMMIQ